MIKIIDNVLPVQVFDVLKRAISSEQMQWFFTPTDVGGGSETEDINNYSFHHAIMRDGTKISPLADLFELAILSMVDKTGHKIKKLHRMRFCLLMARPTNLVGTPHVDMEFPHHAGVLYLNNSDGETILYNEHINYRDNLSDQAYLKTKYPSGLSVKQKVMPQENRFLMFDGSHYHSVSSPTQCARRVIVNFDFELYDT